MTKKKEITFHELYKEQRAEGFTSQRILSEIAEITHASIATVRNWVYTDRTPDALARHAIAEHYDVSADALFPNY